MNSDGSVTQQLKEIRSNDRAAVENAASAIWARYSYELLGFIRQQLSQELRRREDEQDVLQNMFHSFFSRHIRGEFDLNNRQELHGLLMTITLRKVRNTAAHHQRAKRDIRLERAESPDMKAISEVELKHGLAAVSCTEEEAALNEELRRWLPETQLLQIVCEKLEGMTESEIAARHNWSTRTVERKLRIIKKRLAHVFSEE